MAWGQFMGFLGIGRWPHLRNFLIAAARQERQSFRKKIIWPNLLPQITKLGRGQALTVLVKWGLLIRSKIWSICCLLASCFQRPSWEVDEGSGADRGLVLSFVHSGIPARTKPLSCGSLVWKIRASTPPWVYQNKGSLSCWSSISLLWP